MVTIRCKMIVKSELAAIGVTFPRIELGEIEIPVELNNDQLEVLKVNLLKSGLELMDDKRSVLIEKIKNVVIEMVHYASELPRVTNSEYISSKLNYNYNYLANLFSEVQSTTLEQFIILHKIEKVKELLVYDELSLTEIAAKLHYSSVSHLSGQFRKITGLTPSHFKKLKDHRRSALDKLSNEL